MKSKQLGFQFHVPVKKLLSWNRTHCMVQWERVSHQQILLQVHEEVLLFESQIMTIPQSLRTFENCRIDRVLSFLCTGFKRNSISPILNSSCRHRPKQQCAKGYLQLFLESMIFSISTDDGPDEFNPQCPDLCSPCLTESNCM